MKSQNALTLSVLQSLLEPQQATTVPQSEDRDGKAGREPARCPDQACRPHTEVSLTGWMRSGS